MSDRLARGNIEYASEGAVFRTRSRPMCSANKSLIILGLLRWNSHLRIFHLERAFLPSLPALLLASSHLAELLLDDLLNCIPSPGMLAIILSGLTQLELLTLYCFTTPFLQTLTGVLPLPPGRSVLPALTELDFQGISGYFGDLVAGIDAPYLGKTAKPTACHKLADSSTE
jgi:hypothetical protein